MERQRDELALRARLHKENKQLREASRKLRAASGELRAASRETQKQSAAIVSQLWYA